MARSPRRSDIGGKDQGVTVPGVMCGREPLDRTTFQFSELT